jgi:uncharacterized protein (DUF305 family)
MKNISICLLVLGLIAGAASSSGAKDSSPNIQKDRKMTDEASGKKSPPPPPSTLAFEGHVGHVPLYMSIVYTNQADRDFASLLAGHRRGLLELAQLELKFGTDPEMRATAQRIVDAAAAEDLSLQAWRKRNGSK